MRLLAAALAGLLASSSLGAIPSFAAPPTAPALPPKTVAPVTVTPATDPPKIVSSYPAAGQVISPGALVLRITFDQKMDQAGFAFTAAPGGQGLRCLKTPRLLNDEKTFVLLCATAPGSAYALAFNTTAQNAGGGFASIGGSRAVPAELAFSTNEDDGPRDVDAALKAAKLTHEDMPIATQP